jgi:uncharacterized OB-fold protein
VQVTYAKPLPTIEEGSRPFWEAAKRRQVSVQRCLGCGHLRFPPARICPRCRSERDQWVSLSGRGKIWSFTVFHKCYFPGFADEMPYNVAVVELDEGVRMFTNIVGVDNADLEVGMRVRAEFFDATDEVTLIKFRPDVG